MTTAAAVTQVTAHWNPRRPTGVAPQSPEGKSMNRKSFAIVIAVLLILAGGALYWWEQRAQPPMIELGPEAAASAPEAPAPSASVAQAAPVASAPAIAHPIEAAAAASPPASAAPLTLDTSDPAIKQALGDLVGAKAAAERFLLDGFVRRFVVTVDNLDRSHASPRMWPVPPQPGRFEVADAAGTPTMVAGNAVRYTPFVAFAESVDSRRAVSLYVRHYALFQQAYEELGYPGRYFNDRLVGVIDTLLATPNPVAPLQLRLVEVKGPMKSVRPWVRYEYVDAEIEALSSGQKMLLRTGPANEKRMKAKLVEVRALLVGGAAQAAAAKDGAATGASTAAPSAAAR
ncbi:MAG: hypothetical protein JWQ11_1021 [Rhizobacter sp.]|nr:hypothetical protein [Rhizobacter sp.]